MAEEIVYGPGGYDPTKPDNNVVQRTEIEVPAEVTNRITLVDKAAAALATNAKFLALTSPTNAQTLAQVKALTRENTAIIRLLLNKLDSDEGT